MTNEQKHILQEQIKQFFRITLPNGEADAAIATFEATLASMDTNNREAYLNSILRLFQMPLF